MSQQYEYPESDAVDFLLTNAEVWFIPRDGGFGSREPHAAYAEQDLKRFARISLPNFQCPAGEELVIRMRLGRIVVEFQKIACVG